MPFHPPAKIAQMAAEHGLKKSKLPFSSMILLGFLGGAYISLGYLLDIRVTASLPEEWGSFRAFLGASVFPLGLILIILAGGELLTGNMMAVSMAMLTRKVDLERLLYNWFWITITNFIGAIFVAYVFGHIVGLTETGPYMTETVAFARAKIDHTFWESFFSAIGCNWLVGLAVWLSYGSEELSGKILAIWFPIMGFVAIGFQHIVANMFIIPAAIFLGQATWTEFFINFVPVFLGNAVGGSVFVSCIYRIAYSGDLKSNSNEEKSNPMAQKKKLKEVLE